MARPPDSPPAPPAPSSSELWTLQEGVQGVSPHHSFVPLSRRPALFSSRNSRGGVGSGKDTGNNRNTRHPTNHSNNQQPFHATPRARGGPDDDGSAGFGFDRYGQMAFEANTSSSDAIWTEHGISTEGATLNDEGFPLLRRRRTFTEPTRNKSRCSVFVEDGNTIGGHGGRSGTTTGSGRVPMSMSEDNMLSLLRKRSHLERAVPVKPEQLEQQVRQPSSRAVVDKARRNTFVMRLHRAGLVEDLARCVMDIVEGTAAAAIARGETNMGPSRLVTLEDVKEHLQSLPERYSLSVKPEDVLTHMALFDEITVSTDQPSTANTPFPAATVSAPALVGVRRGPPCKAPPTVRVLVHPSRSSTETGTDASESCRPPQPAAEVTPNGDIGSGSRSSSGDCSSTGSDGGGGGGGDNESSRACRRCTVTVACRQSLLPLGAVSSALLSAGAICLDADAMSTKEARATRRPGLSLARFEVDVVVNAGATFRGTAGVATVREANTSAAATKVTAAAAAAAQASGSKLQQQRTGADEPFRLLADLLSWTIAANILEGERKEQREEKKSTIAGGEASEGKACSARYGEDERRIRAQSLIPTAQATVVATSAATESARKEDRKRASLPTIEDERIEVPRHPFHGKTQREALVRRQGGFFQAEASASTLCSEDSSDDFSYGGGGGGGGGGGDSGGGGGGIGGGDSVGGGVKGGVGEFCGGELAKPASRRNSVNSEQALAGKTGSRNPADSISGFARSDGNGSPTILPEDIELLVLVGKGRFSRTYRAKWRGVTVAVKTLESPPPVVAGGREDGAADREDGRSVAVTEFERELHVVRRLRHPNVCGFRGVCVTPPNRLSLVYDFLANGTLGDRLRDTGSDGASAGGRSGGGGGGGEAESTIRLRPKESLSSADLVAIVKDVVNGMIYLHEVEVLHRDLKPGNILLDANDRAVVADFGLAAFCNPVNEHTAETGTYRWMAPEVIRHEPYSRPADVYSFGMVLWQVLTRRQPFEGLTPIQAAFSVASQGLRPPVPPNSVPALSSLINRCWHPNPDLRPSFSQVRTELPEIERQMLSR